VSSRPRGRECQPEWTDRSRARAGGGSSPACLPALAPPTLPCCQPMPPSQACRIHASGAFVDTDFKVCPRLCRLPSPVVTPTPIWDPFPSPSTSTPTKGGTGRRRCSIPKAPRVASQRNLRSRTPGGICPSNPTLPAPTSSTPECLEEEQRALSQVQPGLHLSPEAWHHQLAEAGDETVVIDTRNMYETRIGQFQGPATPTVDPCTRHFSDLPQWYEEQAASLRGKKVLMYCTGGVRCEKACSCARFPRACPSEPAALRRRPCCGAKVWRMCPNSMAALSATWRSAIWVRVTGIQSHPPCCAGLEAKHAM
jgi:rhodanese-related sulfurtransferase